MKKLFIWATFALAFAIGLHHGAAAALVCLVVASFINVGFVNMKMVRLTLSVPELSQLVFDAFKGQTPELFEPGGFALNIESKTASYGDTITAHITTVPTPRDYDSAPGGAGFATGAQNATDLISDIPVTLGFFKHVPIRIKMISQLSSKVDLSIAMKEQGFALRKLLIDTALGVITPANFTHQKAVATVDANLDTMEALRNKANTQKMSAFGRFVIGSTGFMGSLQNDQRIAANTGYNQRNGENAYRRFTNMAGFQNVYEYPDFPEAGNLQAFCGDRRSIVMAVRPINTAKVTPKSLGIPEVMSFTPMVDEGTGVPFVAVGWQEAGTGDLIVSIGILFGVAGGSQGGATDTMTDKAGIRVVTEGAEA